MNKLFCSTRCQKFDDLSNHVDLVTTQCADLLLHTEMRVKYYIQICTWLLVETVESLTFIVEMLNFFRRDVNPVMTKSVFFAIEFID